VSPSIRVQTTQINTQQDAKLVTWLAPAKFFAQAGQKQGLRSYVLDQGVLQFDMVVLQAPQAPVTLAVECEAPCRGEVELTALIRKLPLGQRKTVKIPLLCLEDAGADFLNVDVPFSVSTSRPFSAAFTHIRIVSGAARDADTLACPDIAVKTR
jgi:beta-glucosidase